MASKELHRTYSVLRCINLAFPSCAKIFVINNTPPKITRQSLCLPCGLELPSALVSWPSWGCSACEQRSFEESGGFFPGDAESRDPSPWTGVGPGTAQMLGELPFTFSRTICICYLWHIRMWCAAALYCGGDGGNKVRTVTLDLCLVRCHWQWWVACA